MIFIDPAGVLFMVEQVKVSNVWLSTYGLITVERVLGHYKIILSQEDLIISLKNPNGFFYKLVQTPLMNVMAGLIRQQAYDLQVYAQKLFVDYLLSGETVKPESSPGGLTRDELETTRLELGSLSKKFHECEYEHNKQIAKCQRIIVQALKPWLKELKKSTQNIYALAKKHQVEWSKEQVNALILSLFANLPLSSIDEDPKQVQSYIEWPDSDGKIEELMSIFCECLSPLKKEGQSLIEQTESLEEGAHSIQQEMRQFRKQFEKIIITTNELLRNLPDYHIDTDQDELNRELIMLDTLVTEAASDNE